MSLVKLQETLSLMSHYWFNHLGLQSVCLESLPHSRGYPRQGGTALSAEGEGVIGFAYLNPSKENVEGQTTALYSQEMREENRALCLSDSSCFVVQCSLLGKTVLCEADTCPFLSLNSTFNFYSLPCVGLHHYTTGCREQKDVLSQGPAVLSIYIFITCMCA